MTVQVDAIDIKGHISNMKSEAKSLMSQSMELAARSKEIDAQADKLSIEFSNPLSLLNSKKIAS
jgi:hypothetical protein